jgi:hypothetical protein
MSFILMDHESGAKRVRGTFKDDALGKANIKGVS